MARYDNAIGPTADFNAPGPAFGDIPQLTITASYDDGYLIAIATVTITNGSGVSQLTSLQVVLDGALVNLNPINVTIPNATSATLTFVAMFKVRAGRHTIKAQIHGTGAANNTVGHNGSNLAVIQFPSWDITPEGTFN